jgi:hypothetical protein
VTGLKMAKNESIESRRRKGEEGKSEKDVI